MPYAFPDAPQSIAIAQTCLLVYEIGKETVAGFDEFSLDNPHCSVPANDDNFEIAYIVSVSAVYFTFCCFKTSNYGIICIII